MMRYDFLYQWQNNNPGKRLARMVIISVGLHVAVFFTVYTAMHVLQMRVRPPMVITMTLQPGRDTMAAIPAGGGTPPPPAVEPPKAEQPKPEPPKPEPPKPEPPKPEPPKPEPPKPKPEPKPEAKPKPDPKKTETKKPTKKNSIEPSDPTDEKPQKTPPRPKTKGPVLAASDPVDNRMPTDQPIALQGAGGQGLPQSVGSWPGLFQRQVYLQWTVPNGIPVDDARYLPQVTAIIARDGKVLNAVVSKESPSKELDDSCMLALTTATIPPFPDSFPDAQVTIVVQFSPLGRQTMGPTPAPAPAADGLKPM